MDEGREGGMDTWIDGWLVGNMAGVCMWIAARGGLAEEEVRVGGVCFFCFLRV